LVKLAGELDLSTAPRLREVLVQTEVIDSLAVEIDLTAVEYLDSTSIGLLVVTCKRIRSAGGQFSLRCDEGIVYRVLEVTGLIDLLNVECATRDV
jgi:anti-sigma B factor antagonist